MDCPWIGDYHEKEKHRSWLSSPILDSFRFYDQKIIYYTDVKFTDIQKTCFVNCKTTEWDRLLNRLMVFSVKVKQNDNLKVVSAKYGFDKIDDYLNKNIEVGYNSKRDERIILQ